MQPMERENDEFDFEIHPLPSIFDNFSSQAIVKIVGKITLSHVF